MIDIKDKSKCSGCYSCVNICPQNCILMKTDEEGFWYPVVEKEKCVKCMLCKKSCPILNDMNVVNSPLAYACYNLNENTRRESSSGGLFTLFATKVFEKGGVVYGAAFNNKFEVEHIQITNKDELSKLRGSKYVQSKLGLIYSEIKELLSQNKLVYFSGTPCQIDGLLCFLDRKYNNLICQDIVCHGVPSPKIWRYYLKQFKLDNNAMISFRDKSTGWDQYSFTIEQKKRFTEMFNKNDFMKVFLKNLSLRPSCYNCHSKSLHRNSDITLADFWGVKEICPELYDNMGTSLVFVNSEKGQEIFDEIISEINYKEVNIEEASKYNSSSYKSVEKPKERDEFIENIFINDDFRYVVNKYTKVSMLKKFKNKVRNFLNKIIILKER